jgi:CheY-like chemotaxis protein
MKTRGPIVIVEDDLDDQEMLKEVFQEIAIVNPLRFFLQCLPAFEYLQTTLEKPFLILSDINLPVMTGIEFKKKIDEDRQLREKSIPFIFFSTSANKQTVNEAYKTLTIQGFFQKPSKVSEFKEVMLSILQYWRICKHPDE